MCLVRFNKLGLDKIIAAEEPAPCDQIEEVYLFSPVQSAPLNVDKVVYIDIGTAHSVAVTGEIIFCLHLVCLTCHHAVPEPIVTRNPKFLCCCKDVTSLCQAYTVKHVTVL